MALLWLHRRYAEAFDGAGLTKDFEKLMDVMENLHEARDFIDRMVKVWEAYTTLEDTCRKLRKRVPPTILNNVMADCRDVIEATPLTPLKTPIFSR